MMYLKVLKRFSLGKAGECIITCLNNVPEDMAPQIEYGTEKMKRFALIGDKNINCSWEKLHPDVSERLVTLSRDDEDTCAYTEVKGYDIICYLDCPSTFTELEWLTEHEHEDNKKNTIIESAPLAPEIVSRGGKTLIYCNYLIDHSTNTLYIFYGTGYLMNEQGKTIEKIG